jgi:sugar lactone lactonase YvrE
VFHQYGPGDLPDGVAFGDSGLLYVAIATPGNSGISMLTPEGEQKARLSNPIDPIKPYDSPANVAFKGKGSILVTNHAFVTGVLDPRAFTVLDVYIGDVASPLEKPMLP